MEKRRRVSDDTYQDRYDNKDKGSSNNKCMDWSKVEGSVSFYEMERSGNRISIVPYVRAHRLHWYVLGEITLCKPSFIMLNNPLSAL